MFTPSDLAQLQARGISEEKALKQLQSFATGFPELDIVSAASVGNGVLNPTEEEIDAYVKAWQDYLNEGHTVLKFVPASGAASRMFKDLFEYLETGERTKFIDKFLTEKEHFAFAPQLAGLDEQAAVSHLLKDMNYGNLPKGLLLFHSYEDGARTPALEHLVEGAMYAASKGEVNIHFTVSHEHLPLFQAHLAEYQAAYEEKLGVKFHISYSEQKPSTDTLAANPDGTPFRTADGKLLFRPGGHGALIENLNEQEADVIFIKNIDNVVPDRLKGDTVRYKQLLAGVLVTEQKKIFEQLQDPTLTADQKAKLQRPLRVCGVVKNTGEPGGGPFLVREEDGTISCQILESSQISNPALMQQATHFNPVDLVCATRDAEGKPYYLPDFVDEKTGFISHKSKDGKDLLLSVKKSGEFKIRLC